MVVIDDGKGGGKRAEVNDVNQITTRATSHSEEHFVGKTIGETFLISTGEADITKPTLTFLNTEGGDILHLENNSTTDVVVTAIICSADAAGGIVTLFKNKIQATLTQNTPVVPVNLNFGSPKIPDASSNVWDETNGDGIQGLSGGSILRTFVMPASIASIPTQGTILITQGRALTVSFSNNSGSTIEFECAFRFYFDPELSS